MRATRRRRILLRADASPTIGTGHVIRCQTLALELLRRGWNPTIVTREIPPQLAKSVLASGIPVTELPADLQLDDEPAVLASYFTEPVSMVVVDHYGIGADWQRAAASWARQLVSIDDLADRFQAVDLVLNQNLGASESRYLGLVAPSTRVLCGPAYALMTPDFAAARAKGRTRDGRVSSILVFMSGTDPNDSTQQAARAAARLGVSVDVVVGAGYAFQAELRAWARDQPHIEIHADTRHMADLMERADLAVGAAGSASWERCAVGLPTVIITLADNQIENARLLADAGAGVDLGSYPGVTTDDVVAALTELVADRDLVIKMSAAAARITDGLGAIRVSDELEWLVADVRP